jgi:hypothetical protein
MYQSEGRVIRSEPGFGGSHLGASATESGSTLEKAGSDQEVRSRCRYDFAIVSIYTPPLGNL